ncbi:MAG: PKD domain-containing protein [Chloroflexi bacterium]|jgi:hypothetical protein|nr:PKD domain-containing protein [Chloroflexota bacterium]
MNLNSARLALLLAPNTPLWIGTVTGYDNSTYELSTSTDSGTIPGNVENLLLIREGVEIARVRSVTGTTYTLGETPISYTSGDEVALYDVRLPWPRYQRIDDGTVYKDFDIPFPATWQEELPPTPVALARRGTNEWQEAVFCEPGETINLDASGSFGNLDDAAPLTYTWDAGAGGTITGSGATVTASYTTSGFRYLTLTVTDAHGSTCNRYIPVWIGDAAAENNVTRCSGRWDVKQGWTVDIEIDAEIDMLQYTPAAVVDIETQEVIFFGFIIPSAQTETFERITKTLTLQSAMAFSRYIHAYPFLVTEVTGTDTPSEWADLYEPTLSRALWFLLFWHSTLPEVANVDLGDAPTRAIAGQEFTLGTLPQQTDAILKSAFWHARCNRAGGFIVKPDPLYLDDSDWAALPVRDLSDPADLRESIRTTYAEPTVNQVRFGGVYQDTGGSFEPALAQAPVAPGPWGSPSEVNNLAPATAAELRTWAARHIAIENTADEIEVTPGAAIDPAGYQIAELPATIKMAIEKASLEFNTDAMRWRITIGGRTYGRTANAVDVPVPPETEFPTPSPPPALPPIWDPIPDDPGLYALVATSKGLYRSDDIELDAAGDPVWYVWGDELHIRSAAFDPDNPQALQLGISSATPGDPTTDELYIRRPSVTGTNWQQILTMAQALSLIGFSSTGKERFRYSAFDPLNEIVYLTMQRKLTGGKFLFKSTDYGSSWTAVDQSVRYKIGDVVVFSDGTVFMAVSDGLGGLGQIWESGNQGVDFSLAYDGRGGNWYPHMFVDRVADVLYAGAFTLDNDYRLLSDAAAYEYIDTTTYKAGIIDTVRGCGYGLSDYLRTARDDTLFYTNDGATTWGSVTLSVAASRAMDGDADGNILLARRDATAINPHLIFATYNGSPLYNKGGANADQTDGGGDSVPYSAIVADKGVAIGLL